MTTPPTRPSHLDSPIVPSVMKYGAKAQVWLYRRTGGRIGGKWRIGSGFRKPVPVLLLGHRGRKSATEYTTPLIYLLDDDNVIVVASQGGMPKNPQWYSNLMASPDTWLQIGSERRDVSARTADSSERARLWPLLVKRYADFANYQAWTDREIPVVVLTRR